jgi:hypothetical protein
LPDGSVTADDIASTLDLSGKTVTLPAGTGGKVLQVVGATYSTETLITTTSYVDSGLTATITPSSASNKILVSVGLNGFYRNGTHVGRMDVILANGSDAQLLMLDNEVGDNSTTDGSGNNVMCSYLHSPSTTSAYTYKIRLKMNTASAGMYFCVSSSTSTITLMEIAA